MAPSRKTTALFNLRTTSRSALRAVIPVCLVCAGLTATGGCSGEERDAEQPQAAVSPNEPTAAQEAAPNLPPPAPEQIEYDQASHTLTLYQLPGSARWHVLLPGQSTPAPAAGRHRLPTGIDPDRTFVYYATPGGHQSVAVTLRQIQRAQAKGHSSQLR
jgi:hypothetical protein